MKRRVVLTLLIIIIGIVLAGTFLSSVSAQQAPKPDHKTYNYREWYLQGVWQVHSRTPDSPALGVLFGLSETYIRNFVMPNTGEDYNTARVRIVSALGKNPSDLRVHTAVVIEAYRAGNCAGQLDGQCYMLSIMHWALSEQVMPALGSTVTYESVHADDYEPEWANWNIPRPSKGQGPGTTPVPTPVAPPPTQTPFKLDWEVSTTNVEAGESFILSARMYDIQQAGDHGGISVSFPWLTEPGGSSETYSFLVGDVELIDYTTGASNVTFHQPGETIYHSDNNAEFPAEYLLVESDDGSWPRSADRTLRLRITPKLSGEFPIRIRGWICANDYENCSRQPTTGAARDQQGWAVESVSVSVAAPSTPTTIQLPGQTVKPSDRTFNGAIDPAGDKDEYTIFQESSGPIEIAVSDIPLAEPGSTNKLSIAPSWGGSVTLESGRRYIWRQVSRGNYTIRVQSTSKYNDFPYTIKVTTTKDDFAETRESAHRLSSGQRYSDAIRPDGDVDYFSIAQESSGPIEIAVSDIPLAEPGSTNKLSIAPSWGGSVTLESGRRYIWRQVSRGNYTIRVQSTSKYNDFPYTIKVTFNDR